MVYFNSETFVDYIRMSDLRSEKSFSANFATAQLRTRCKLRGAKFNFMPIDYELSMWIEQTAAFAVCDMMIISYEMFQLIGGIFRNSCFTDFHLMLIIMKKTFEDGGQNIVWC